MRQNVKRNQRASCLFSCLFMALCVLLLCQREVHAEDVDQDFQQLLITIKNEGRSETSVFKSFNRGYASSKKYGGILAAQRKTKSILKDYSLLERKSWQIEALSIYCILVDVPSERKVKELVALLEKDDRVETVQPLYDYYVESRGDYNDTYVGIQFDEQAQALSAMHDSVTGRGVKIAIVDTGVDVNHPDLKGQIKQSHNFIDANQQRFRSDIHGTAVAGIIAAKPGNKLGIVGLAPNAEVWALKACWQLQKQRSEAQCNSFTVASAISHAIDNEADIINISFAGPYDPLIARLVDAATSRNMLVVASDPVIGDNRYPALLPNVVAARQIVPDTSSETDLNSSIYVNGNDILSTGPGGGFDFFSGSSMSAARVSAYSALIIERDKQWLSREVVDLISQIHQSKKL